MRALRTARTFQSSACRQPCRLLRAASAHCPKSGRSASRSLSTWFTDQRRGRTSASWRSRTLGKVPNRETAAVRALQRHTADRPEPRWTHPSDIHGRASWPYEGSCQRGADFVGCVVSLDRSQIRKTCITEVPPNGVRLSWGALVKDPFPNVRAPAASGAG